jgi:hypothetical protein
MNRNCFGAVVGLCLALATMGLAKMFVWRQAGTYLPRSRNWMRSTRIAALIIPRLFCVPRAP